ncbi:LIM and calponin homology domains-containing protein 1-like isoform X4 [Chelmon rostratus]|uniref:LIM and calponin homology domains-containing protein 1-like isoform X4 n=1 Tax=Chelmon rostratus TaxID=109905 RepID=UPI001BEB8D79|nr:LIM and calponin homology domains-containing protein 1-like isoform X4 [Chelmon rostratus]
MASPAAGRDVPNAPARDESERAEPNHPEPACQEAQKWIEAVTGKSFGDKDFRSGLENGILLCELLSAIKPGLVKKINRLPTPIAGLDNLSVFLRGCEELGLKGSQLFDPGDLQDTSIRANLKDSDCNRKLKNVLNTVFWLGKAASGCASYSGPTLNLKEFEGLLAQMKVESEEGGESPQKRSVRDSGYDCWDSERSESLSPPRHTRDNSLDSLDSFGSRSQHSPSPDVVNRGNSDGRGSDSEVDGRRPDVRKDDMLARRTASSDSRSSIPFNQFLPNRTNASSYIPAPRRKPHPEEGEQRRSVSMSDMLNEEEVGHLPQLSQSRYERMHEQYNSFLEDEDHWQDDLARWKNRRRSASQELIKKEEERKRMEKRMKEEGSTSNKRKSIKTYKEIVEEKERREAELCEAYRNAATPEEAAMVLQRYALRFTISDATLDSLKLPRSTSKPKQDLKQADKEEKTTSPVSDSETSEPLQTPEPTVITDQAPIKPEETEADTTAQQETAVTVSPVSPTPGSPLSPVTNSENVPPQSLQLNEPQSKPAESPTTHQQQPTAGDAKPQTKHMPPQIAQVQPHTTQPVHTLPSPPSVSPRPVPLLAAKPYCQPRSMQSGHKPVKMDGLVRVNGEATDDLSVSTPPTSAQHSPQEVKDVPSEQTEKDVPAEQTATNQETAEPAPPPQIEKSAGSAISSLIGGRNCIITTTIVTELTQTLVEPYHPDIQSNGQVNGATGLSERPVEEKKAQPATSPNSMQDYSPTVTEGLEESSVTIETPMLNLAKRVNHWVWDPNEERKRLESWQQEQERLLQEQYQKEQEKLKKEWERAQLEVEEEERKHNEEERRILEETVTPLNPTGLLNQQSSATENNQVEEGNVPLQQNGQRISTGNEDQHASKLHFFQNSVCDGEPSKKQELWKTASLDRNPQPNQAHIFKRSESHDAVTSKQQSSPQPPSPSRCVSGKRLCSGCSQPLGKGAAMIIDTLGLFFHMDCFKCGVCRGQLGDATAGTDVRIRNGLLSCHECYIASRGRGQPTTL